MINIFRLAKVVILTFLVLILMSLFVGCSSEGIEDEESKEKSETEETEEVKSQPVDGVDSDGLEGGGLIFSFDDGYRTDYEVVYPILESRDLKAVTYISPIFIDEKVEEYMSWEQVKELDEAGWDVEDHTYSHPNLTELTKDQIHEEMQKVDEVLTERGLDIPKHHAFTHGEFNDDVKDVVFSYRKTARTVENDLNTFPLDDEDDYIIIDAVDMAIHSKESIEDFINRAVEENKLLVLFTHDVQEEPYEYGIETEKFKSVVDYAIDKGINIMTMSDLMEIQ